MSLSPRPLLLGLVKKPLEVGSRFGADPHELSRGAAWAPRFEPEKARLAVPAAAHSAAPHAREPVTEAMPKSSTEAPRVGEAMVKMVKTVHDNDRWSETEKPGHSTPTPIVPAPIRGEIGKGIGFEIRIGRGIW